MSAPCVQELVDSSNAVIGTLGEILQIAAVVIDDPNGPGVDVAEDDLEYITPRYERELEEYSLTVERCDTRWTN